MPCGERPARCALMTTGQESYIQAVKRFNRWLTQRSLRKTQERFAVLKAAWQIGGHFSAEQLRAQLEKVGYHVSRGTVYNTLSLLEECGVLRRHHFGAPGGEALFEKGVGNHLHLICTVCGSVTECEAGPELMALLEPGRYGGFTPAHLGAYIYGLCADCAAQAQPDIN